MKRLLRDLTLILALASLWAISGFVIGIALETAGIPYPPLKFILASLNFIIGMLLFQGITRDPTAERIFFEGRSLEVREISEWAVYGCSRRRHCSLDC